jgi:hypothetical protein
MMQIPGWAVALLGVGPLVTAVALAAVTIINAVRKPPNAP